jgi:hypothetical protein
MLAYTDELFGEDAIMVYPDRTPAENLKHSYVDFRTGINGRKIDFDEVHTLLRTLRSDVNDWYQEETRQPMDTYKLGQMLDAVQQKFWSDERFKSALDLLGLPYEKRKDVKMPWWNEVAGGELEHRVDSDGIHVKLCPRHSYETQLIRSGHPISVKSVSVGGIIMSEDYIVIGLRGGKSFPNTYHINAGALRVTEGLKRNEETIHDIFKKVELEPEFGVQEKDISESTLISRVMDYSIEQGPMYVFLVKTNLSTDQLTERWKINQDEDKKEHIELRFVRASPDSVNLFIRKSYVGLCENSLSRASNERYLLHPGALGLASFSGMPVSELKNLYKEGVH